MKFAYKDTLWPSYIFNLGRNPLEMRNKLNFSEFGIFDDFFTDSILSCPGETITKIKDEGLGATLFSHFKKIIRKKAFGTV